MRKRTAARAAVWGRLGIPAVLVAVVAVVSSFLASSVRTVTLPALSRAATGVRVAGRLVEGRDAADLEQRLAALARRLPQQPVDARLDHSTGAVPALDGVQVDVAATVTAVLQASSGADVPLHYRRLPAAITLWDLPPAPIWQGNPAKNQVALTINVAWGNEYLPDLLAVLKSRRIRASFFLVGGWAEKFPDLARRIADAGHEIASHGYSTTDYAGLAPDRLRRQVVDAEEAIVSATGQRPTLFSPHKGEWTPELLALLREEEYLPIHWTVDTVDWRNPAPQEMVARVLSKVGSGSIILLHPTAASAAGLGPLLDGIRAKGLEVVDVSTLLDPDPLAGL